MIGSIETDRFCDECGFNMRTLPVFRDDRTQLLLARCTECGRLHPAAQLTSARNVWLTKLAVLLIVFWVFLLLWFTFVLGVAQTVVHALFHEIAQSGTTENLIWSYSILLSVAFCAAFILISAYTCVCHHWPRWGYVLLALFDPVIPATIAWQAWLHDMPELMPIAWKYITPIAATQLTGALIAAFVGRRVVRALATALIPPRTRTMLGFLWLADGLTPPAPPGRRASSASAVQSSAMGSTSSAV